MSATRDAERIFTGIASSYDRVATVLSLGQDPRWRRAAVEWIAARPGDRVLDVATGTGLVAQALHDRYGCHVVGLDQSPDMLRLARTRSGVYDELLEGRAESLPFADGTFDGLTFTYLLRYVDDPAATMRELARVLKPGGRIAMVEFGLPSGIWRPFWWAYTRTILPLGGRMVSRRWASVGAFLGPNIERFYRANPLPAVVGYWQDAGLVDVRARRMSVGGGVVVTASKATTSETAGGR
jgi:demethylmenaquinone methyltransferase/2-methoxy-6-polyprenyl-1,4-benzoquinol methylase